MHIQLLFQILCDQRNAMQSKWRNNKEQLKEREKNRENCMAHILCVKVSQCRFLSLGLFMHLYVVKCFFFFLSMFVCTISEKKMQRSISFCSAMTCSRHWLRHFKISKLTENKQMPEYIHFEPSENERKITLSYFVWIAAFPCNCERKRFLNFILISNRAAWIMLCSR